MKTVFLNISQSSQEDIYARVSFLIKLQALGTGISEFSNIFKNTISYRTPLVTSPRCNISCKQLRIESLQ